MRMDRLVDVVVWIFIFLMGLVAAYVCFGILNSQASGQYQGYSLGGAIVGAVVSWSVMLSVYQQLRGTSDEVQELRNRAEELQHKLIRGAPRPKGYDTEVDEKQRIVLARPSDWEPKGGMIFALEEPDEKMKPTDNIAAAFQCYVVPIEKNSGMKAETFYANKVKEFQDAPHLLASFSQEVVQLGGEPAPVNSLKIIAHQFVRVQIIKHKETGRTERKWVIIRRDEFVGQIDFLNPWRVPAGAPAKVTLVGHGFGKGAVVYVNGKQRTGEFVDSHHVAVMLTKEDVANPGVVSIELQNPETAKLRSNAVSLMVTEPDSKAGGPPAPAAAPPSPAVPATAEPAAAEPSPATDATDGALERIVFQEISRMLVFCYHENLGRIFFFEFVDDVNDFKQSSEIFNRILVSARFLE